MDLLFCFFVYLLWLRILFLLLLIPLFFHILFHLYLNISSLLVNISCLFLIWVELFILCSHKFAWSIFSNLANKFSNSISLFFLFLNDFKLFLKISWIHIWQAKHLRILNIFFIFSEIFKKSIKRKLRLIFEFWNFLTSIG